MRRRPGIGAIQKHKLEQEKFRDKGNEIQENQLEELTKQMEVFRSKLEDFAIKHRNDIRKDPEFRKQFQDMCASIGVDPLASSKGFWSELLGVGEFYYELSVQAIEVCLATSHRNGGILTLDELRQRLVKARGKAQHHQDISNDDILRAISKLKVLGSGFSVVPLGKNSHLVRSVPGELSMDHTAILQTAQQQDGGWVTVSSLNSKLQWDPARSKEALQQLIRDGVAWIDEQNGEPKYWFPSFFPQLLKGN
uniref:Vacuolar-sorting protein SNF8 n=1 Tax=Lynceus sp. MCZ IZ 141354 TaxID=1930659 RepID=A0A9N6WU84_9CRUS|nr:EOG090X09XM [Lynceus sp. MCZ IZ 141354]